MPDWDQVVKWLLGALALAGAGYAAIHVDYIKELLKPHARKNIDLAIGKLSRRRRRAPRPGPPDPSPGEPPARRPAPPPEEEPPRTLRYKGLDWCYTAEGRSLLSEPYPTCPECGVEIQFLPGWRIFAPDGTSTHPSWIARCDRCDFMLGTNEFEGDLLDQARRVIEGELRRSPGRESFE